MAGENPKDGLMVVVGLIGIVVLLVGSLAYAIRDSGAYYEAERVNDFVIQEQAAGSETGK